jgi:hypothetical protein
MFEYIGKIAGVKCVSITEHEAIPKMNRAIIAEFSEKPLSVLNPRVKWCLVVLGLSIDYRYDFLL